MNDFEKILQTQTETSINKNYLSKTLRLKWIRAEMEQTQFGPMEIINGLIKANYVKEVIYGI